MPNYPYPVPEGIEIVWETDVRDDRQDACWYMDTNAIATVRYNGKEVMVDRNGEFYATLSVEDEDTEFHFHDTASLMRAGILDDADLMEADMNMSWTFNPWFDSYLNVDGVGEHLDLVEYSVYDAVKAAIDWMVNNA